MVILRDFSDHNAWAGNILNPVDVSGDGTHLVDFLDLGQSNSFHRGQFE